MERSSVDAPATLFVFLKAQEIDAASMYPINALAQIPALRAVCDTYYFLDCIGWNLLLECTLSYRSLQIMVWLLITHSSS